MIALLFIDLVELIMVTVTFPFSIYLAKKLYVPDLELKTWEAILFFVYMLMSWLVISRISSLAKIPRAQRYLPLIFQYARTIFIVFVSLIALKLVFHLSSVPVQLIVIYIVSMFIVTLFFKLFALKILKIHRSFESNSQRVLIIADAFSDGIIEILLAQLEWRFIIQSIVSDSKLIKAKYGAQFQIHPSSVDLKVLLDGGIIDEVIYCKRDMNIRIVYSVCLLLSSEKLNSNSEVTTPPKVRARREPFPRIQ